MCHCVPWLCRCAAVGACLQQAVQVRDCGHVKMSFYGGVGEGEGTRVLCKELDKKLGTKISEIKHVFMAHSVSPHLSSICVGENSFK